MIYCFDIDGVICRTEGTDYENAEPIPEVIERIRALRRAGHVIRYYTGRGWGPNGTAETGERWTRLLELTYRQLGKWGLPAGVVHRKPPADVYVDDRAVNVRDW